MFSDFAIAVNCITHSIQRILDTKNSHAGQGRKLIIDKELQCEESITHYGLLSRKIQIRYPFIPE